MPTYSTIYDEPRFRRGFSLIVSKSNEKETIASYLTQKIKLLLSDREVVNILDLAGGSGDVWVTVSKLLAVAGFNPAAVLSVKLIDSSEEQIQAAKSLNLPFLDAQQADATRFLKSFTGEADLICCLHFLPGLGKNLQKEVFTDCKNILAQGGIFVSVQPNIDNPLTEVKIKLRKNLLGIDYEPSYLTQADLSPDKIDIDTFPSYLYLNKSDLKDLGYFLLGEHVANKKLSRVDEDYILTSLEEIVVGDRSLEIKLINDYLVWRKNG
jgi:SAM-dependent methyltransferase